MSMNYWDLRDIVMKIIPRRQLLLPVEDKVNAVREKGRKSNFKTFSIVEQEWQTRQRLLNTEEVKSFLEISVRAQACPMPLNLDVYDGLLCPFGCKYCYADAFRASLYSAFFDNYKTMGIRHCNPDYYKAQLDKIMSLRGKDPHEIKNEVHKAVAMEIPMRLGIRFEDFTKIEAKRGISLAMLQYLSELSYPVMINTKSDLVGRDDYVEALSSNEAGAAVHITMISNDENLLRKIEPGAPTFKKRIAAAKALTDAGVRVVARIEPFLVFLTDHREKVEEYMDMLEWAGVKNITFDTYSYSANNPGIRQSFYMQGYDFERLFVLGCDSQGIGSLLLEKFMDLFRERGISCSTFDLGNAPTNDQTICCEVGDWFKGGFNYGSVVGAARFITGRKGKPVSWSTFVKYVDRRGGFLSSALKKDVHQLWNGEGNWAYSLTYVPKLVPVGRDDDGIIWSYQKNYPDFRWRILQGARL